MLRFLNYGYEEQFHREREKGPHEFSRNLQVLLTICWIIGLCKYAPTLLMTPMPFGTTLKYGSLVFIQCVMVGVHAWGALQFSRERTWDEAGTGWAMEDLKVCCNIAEITANMVCTILDDNAVRQISLAYFPPSVMGPTLQGWFPILDGIRLSAHLPVQTLRCVTFIWMEVDSLVRYNLQDPSMDPNVDLLYPKLVYDVAMVAVFGILVPILVNMVLEVKVRRSFLQRWGKPLEQLGPFWLDVHHWVTWLSACYSRLRI